MTYEETILELQHQIEMLPKEPPEDYNGNIEVWFKDYNTIVTARIKAINALEKQIPKKPKIVTTYKKVGIQEMLCPLCHKFFGERIKGDAILFHTPNFCECCGQALDWSD